MPVTIRLKDIEVYALHGCFEQENIVGNRYLVDVELRVDASKCIATDDVRDAVNYVEISNIVKAQMKQTHHLIEVVANNIATAIKAYSADILGGKVSVKKMAPPVGKMQYVEAEIEF